MIELRAVELRRVAMPLVTPFATSHGTERVRDVLLVRVETDDGEGWGECVAPSEPTYTAEYADGAHAVLRDHLVPRLFEARHVSGTSTDAATVAEVVGDVVGHRMAKAAIEVAVVDAELRRTGTSLATALGVERDRVEVGVAVGMAPTVDGVVQEVGHAVAAGYRRIKLKVAPGYDIEPVRAVRKAFPELRLQVDGNGAYTLDDAAHLAHLDEFHLLLIEQPLPAEDLLGHAELARRVATPVCLDESIDSIDAARTALAVGACSVVNIKPGRLGGIFEAKRVHDLCAELGVDAWCGGMLETGLGRAVNVAVAALPGFTLPGDLSASDRYYADDITAPFVLDGGALTVPAGPGIGVAPDPDRLAAATTSVEVLRA